MKGLVVFLLAIAGCLVLTITFPGCAKEYSFEGGDTTMQGGGDTVITPVDPGNTAAIYLLEGNPDCTDPGIRGSYESGYKMNVANYLEVLVDVSSIGNYTITSDTVNGFYFAATGKFTKTGTQRVTLAANGTPLKPGLYSFHLDAGASACGFSITVVFPGYPATYVLESNYDSSCTNHTVYGVYKKGVALDNSNKVSIRTYSTIAGVYALQTNTINGVSFSSEGTIATTGVNYLDIFATGTPIEKGTFTYKLKIIGPAPLGGASCGIDINFE